MDKTDSKALILRRTIYLTIMSRSLAPSLSLPLSLFLILPLHTHYLSLSLHLSFSHSASTYTLSLSLLFLSPFNFDSLFCSLDYEECAHKLLKTKEDGQEVMIPHTSPILHV